MSLNQIASLEEKLKTVSIHEKENVPLKVIPKFTVRPPLKSEIEQPKPKEETVAVLFV